jgi:hypothetical protein
LVTITVAGHRLEATGNHPFWVASGANLSERPAARDVPPAERAAVSELSGRWVEARSLLPGDLLVVRNGQMATVEEIAARRAKLKVYNLQVTDLHTYAVGELGIAVHNKAMQIAPIGTAEPRGGIYLLRDADSQRVMRTGRTNDLLRREAEHALDPLLSDYEFEIVHRTDAYAEQRGLEQELDWVHNPPLNYKRPIDPNSARLLEYLRAANNYLDRKQGIP